MALTRKSLKAMGLDDEKIDSVIEMHTETIESLKSENEKLRGDATRAADLQKQLDEANEKLSKTDPNAAARIQKELDDYKAAVAAEKATAAKRTAYRKIIEDNGITGVLADMIADRVDYGKVEMDGDAIKGADAIGAEIAKTYAAYIPTMSTRGQKTQTPPQGQAQCGDDDLSDEEYFAKYDKKTKET